MKTKLLVALLFLSAHCFANSDLLFSPNGIAEVHLTLPPGMTLDDIQKDVDSFIHMEIKNSTTSTYSPTELYSGEIIIEGRGNSSWGNPKKPYNIDLIDEFGEDKETPLLGMGKHHKWCLIAFYSDKSLMRIPLAHYLGQNMSNISWTPHLHYVELYVNGEYRGLYGLCEKIDRDKNRINLPKLTDAPEDQVEPNVSGGYIIEVTPNDRVKPGEKSFSMKHCSYSRFTFTYPKNKNVTDPQIEWIKNYVHKFEDALYGDNFKDENQGYRKYIDEDTFIDWYILNEFSLNCDASMYASVYFQKDRNGKLCASAPWDFDLAFGNYHNECQNDDIFRIKYHPWWNRLFEDERFRAKVRDRYDELMPLLNKIPHILKANLEALEANGCVQRNFQKWNILGKYVWPNVEPYPTSHFGEVVRLTEWIDSRKNWMYINLGISSTERGQRMRVTRPTIRTMDPDRFMNKQSSDIYLMAGYSTSFNPPSYQKYTYTLMRNNSQISSSTNSAYEIKKDGEYYVEMKDKNGYESLSSYPITFGEKMTYHYLTESTPSNIDNPSANIQLVEVYPNPVSEILYINYPNKKEIINIQLVGINGLAVENINTDLCQVNVSHLPNGLYLLLLNTKSGLHSKKIIISH